MTSIAVRTTIAAPAALLWDLVGRFNAVGQWHPLVKRSRTHGAGEGAVRELSLFDGGTITERLEHVSDEQRVYRYSVVASPLPVARCVAEIRVRDAGDGTSVVEWWSSFVPAGPETEVTNALASLFSTGLDNIKRIYESL
jgi:Polyketide cyclase / dehydrase and lipid transport